MLKKMSQMSSTTAVYIFLIKLFFSAGAIRMRF